VTVDATEPVVEQAHYQMSSWSVKHNIGLAAAMQHRAITGIKGLVNCIATHRHNALAHDFPQARVCSFT
jgi:hypothetical protein